MAEAEKKSVFLNIEVLQLSDWIVMLKLSIYFIKFIHFLSFLQVRIRYLIQFGKFLLGDIVFNACFGKSNNEKEIRLSWSSDIIFQ